MKILKDKTLRGLFRERDFYRDMNRDLERAIAELFINFIPFKEEITKQEMILNFQETLKFEKIQ